MSRDGQLPVVTGMGMLTPISVGVQAFTEAIRKGQSAIDFVDGAGAGAGFGASPGARAGVDAQVVLGAELRDLNFTARLTDHAVLGEQVLERARRIARRAPLTVQASVLVALEAWQHAGLHRASAAPDRVSILVAGNNLAGRYVEDMARRFDRGPGLVRPTFALQYQDSNHVGVVSAVLPIAGEGSTVGAASASGSVALAQAARTIAVGAADVCVVIGALSELAGVERASYLNLGAMAAGRLDWPAAAQCRPFDVDRAGFVPGHGAACVVLESSASAARRGAVPLAALLGQAVRLDGNHSADPSRPGEVGVMRAALATAGLAAGDVQYVNTHGTGSPLGDDTEAAALSEVFDGHTDRVWISATKALTGHCLSSAGVVEAVATVVQLRGGFVHPNPHLDRPIAPLRFAGAVAEIADLEVALSNSFGFGGINACLVLGRETR